MGAVMLAHYRALTLLAIRGAGVYAVLTGALVLVGGDARMQSQAYRALRDLTWSLGLPPAPTLGAFLILAGVVTLVPRYAPSQAGLFGIVLFHLYVSMSFTLSVYTEPRAGVLGVLGTLFIGTMCGGLIAVRHADKGVHHA